MKKILPSYYSKFKCIADKCKHSCCIGWEICIDKDTLCKYDSVHGDLKSRFEKNIKIDGENFSFILDSNKRCPFLNKSGLCDIITELGEDYLSQICRDHPRFRNFFSDRVDLGIGLCCEEACRIILLENEKTTFEVVEDDSEDFGIYDDELLILSVRERLLDISQDRTLNIESRIEEILNLIKYEFPEVDWLDTLKGFQIMDKSWAEILNEVGAITFSQRFDKHFSIPFEQLLVYFLFRHLADSESREDLFARIAFSVLSVKIINCLFEAKRNSSNDCDFQLLCDISRMYSSEIEYCEENTAYILNILRN